MDLANPRKVKPNGILLQPSLAVDERPSPTQEPPLVLTGTCHPSMNISCARSGALEMASTTSGLYSVPSHRTSVATTTWRRPRSRPAADANASATAPAKSRGENRPPLTNPPTCAARARWGRRARTCPPGRTRAPSGAERLVAENPGGAGGGRVRAAAALGRARGGVVAIAVLAVAAALLAVAAPALRLDGACRRANSSTATVAWTAARPEDGPASCVGS